MTRHPTGCPQGADDIKRHLERKWKEHRDPAAQASGNQGGTRRSAATAMGRGALGRRRKGGPRDEAMGARGRTPGGRGRREVTA